MQTDISTIIGIDEKWICRTFIYALRVLGKEGVGVEFQPFGWDNKAINRPLEISRLRIVPHTIGLLSAVLHVECRY